MDPFRLFPALDPVRLSACSVRRAAGHCSIRVRAAPPGHASPSLVSPCLLPKLALISFAQVSPPVSWPSLLAAGVSLPVARRYLQYLQCLHSCCIPVLRTACALLVFNGFLPVIMLSFLALCSFMCFPCGSQKSSLQLQFKSASLVETAFAHHYLQPGGTQTALP